VQTDFPVQYSSAVEVKNTVQWRMVRIVGGAQRRAGSMEKRTPQHVGRSKHGTCHNVPRLDPQLPQHIHLAIDSDHAIQ
jgi:hypothetical protein